MKMLLEFQEKKKKYISTLLALFNVDMTGTIHIKNNSCYVPMLQW